LKNFPKGPLFLHFSCTNRRATRTHSLNTFFYSFEMEEEAFNSSSSRDENNTLKDEEFEGFEDALTSDDDYSGDEEDQEEEEEERRRRFLKNEGNFQRRREMKRDVRKWQKMNATMRGRGDLGKERKNTNIVCPPVLPPQIDATQQVRGVNCGNIGPELEKLRFEQGENREYYTKEHFDRL